MVIWMLLTTVILAANSHPSEAVTAKVRIGNESGDTKQSIVRSSSIPAGSLIFDHEDEMLASIETANSEETFCSLIMSSVGQNKQEKPYGDWICPESWLPYRAYDSLFLNLDANPPLEF